MVIYEAAKQPREIHELADIALDVADHLFPEGEILDSKMSSDMCQLFLRDREQVTGFELYASPLQEDSFERILNLAFEVEEKRRECGGSLPKEITLCLVASNFSDALLERIRSRLFNIRLFQWSWLRSDRCDALWLQHISNSVCDAQIEVSYQASSYRPKRELSTPELIAMARFGIELRNRRAEISWEPVVDA